jgi:hypothetical protein
MTFYDYDYSAVSKTAWESVMFAAVNAGLSRGIFGRSPEDMGCMDRLDPEEQGHPDYGARYAFQHAGHVFEARVRTHCRGAELGIDVWVPSEERPPRDEARFGALLKNGFDLIAFGWLERERGFGLDGRSSSRELQARQHLRRILKAHPVSATDFWVRRPVGYSNSRRNHA